MSALQRRIVSLALLLAAVSTLLAAQSQEWGVDLAFSSEARMGVMGEYVYSTTQTVSYLRWELLPLITAGIELEAEAPWGTAFGATLTLPVNRRTGSMTNSDYEDAADPLRRTRVSYHDAFVDTYRDVEVALSQRFVIRRVNSLVVGVGYRDRFVKMISQDGTFDYGSTSGDVTGVPITYQQHQRIPFVLLGGRAGAGGGWDVITQLSFAPYVSVDALDHHHRRLLDFYDTVRGAIWFEGELGLAFTLWGQQVEISAFGELIPETKGDTYTVDYTTNSFEGTTGPTVFNGAGVSWWNAGVSMTIRYGW